MHTDASLLDSPSAESIRIDTDEWAADGDATAATSAGDATATAAGDGAMLHAVTAGDPADPLVVLLHGFPDFWYGWRDQIPALVEAGYRVVVPDQRGYNLSENPDGVGQYRVERLSADIAAVIRSTGRESAHVVGHDWGATVAWDLALRRPSSVDRLGILNVPHPTVFRRTLRRSPRQLLRSWYVFSFQLPRIPEWGLGRKDCAGLERALLESSRGDAFTEADLERYHAAWRQPGVVGSMIDWYRAAARYGLDPGREEVTAPTLICWGEQDDALLPTMADESLSYCADGRLERFPTASHWVHVDESERVNGELLEHLSTPFD
jgi:pimeloyl-ACP methyl ester carboxylesterase